MTPTARLSQAMRLSETTIRLCESGIRAHHPEYDDRQIFLARALIMLRSELYAAAYPHEPQLDP